MKVDLALSRQIHFVEKEYGQLITDSYNYHKFLSQVDYLGYINEQVKKESKKHKKK